MEDISNLRLVERTFTVENTLAENALLKKDKKFLITTTLILGVVVIGLLAYSIDQELQKK